ncbi:CRISPR-associated RAMP protein, Cmr6 family [Pyrobaculum neutrophilum V24Sta]|uniref:CRISPR-associated RAMP protein, Cmr6 family n=1 Tax=Pyrobaculum neutrophilum (strain DSM 2338 / JCM 9278 / NBRC 100436 / V24Sta) TaxID=444157 RepID=B1YCJ6_PYRNV|nr:CRISPR-associated RAMP protein, Cmr6 family [Pyrobaculum neutrophilum V24Sta]
MKRPKKREEREVDYGKYFSSCAGDYNVVSCVNLAFLEASRDLARQNIRLRIPEFSRWAVLTLHQRPPQMWDQVKRYLELVYAAARGAFQNVFKFEFSLETPLTIHTRWPYLPLEIGIAWHPILNVPYIPASSLKGALRAAAPEPVCDFTKAELFGTAQEEGLLVVFDAYPTGGKAVRPDVVTPHYREVEGEIAETQASPVPLVFPTVPPGTKFQFMVGILPRDEKREVDYKKCEMELFDAVKKTLVRGLGAKTAVGYGVFKI